MARKKASSNKNAAGSSSPGDSGDAASSSGVLTDAATAPSATLSAEQGLDAITTEEGDRRIQNNNNNNNNEGGEEEEPLELLQVDLGDMIKLKQILDEAVAAALLESPHPVANTSPTAVWVVPEDFAWENIKLALMVVCCAFAAVAQFAPLPFPEARWTLGLCGAAYFVLSGLLQVLTVMIDQDTILLTHPCRLETLEEEEDEIEDDDADAAESKNNKSKKQKSNNNNHKKKATAAVTTTPAASPSVNADLLTHGIRVRSQLPRYSEWYTVVLELRRPTSSSPSGVDKSSSSKDSKKKKAVVPKAAVSPADSAAPSAAAPPVKGVQQKWSIGQFFDKEGYFDEVGLTEEVAKLFQRLVAGQYDSDLMAAPGLFMTPTTKTAPTATTISAEKKDA